MYWENPIHKNIVNPIPIPNTIAQACHQYATPHLTLSVCWSVDIVLFYFMFFWSLASQLLPKCSSDLKYSLCPLACYSGSLVFGPLLRFWAAFSLLPLPYCLVGLFCHCPCPSARTFKCCVSSLFLCTNLAHRYAVLMIITLSCELCSL